MAREAGFNLEQGFLLRVTGIDEDLKRFEALIRADERKDRTMKLPEYLNSSYEGDDLFTGDQLRAVVLAEREACAKVCDALHYEVDAYGAQCAAAIRARGNT
jgi:hypothetical protein